MMPSRSFEKLFFNALREKYDELQQQPDVRSAIAARIPSNGRLAVAPCSHFARRLVTELISDSKEDTWRLVGCFDSNPNPNFVAGVKTYHLERINRFDIDLVVVAASRFFQDTVEGITRLGVDHEKILPVSGLDSQLLGIEYGRLNEGLKRVLSCLADEKSKADYLLVWLAYILGDPSILEVFTSPSISGSGEDGQVEYAGFQLSGIADADCREELFEEIYRIAAVGPCPGDVALDLGAYRGDTVAFLEKYIGSHGHIYAFEPDACNARYLLENIARNKFTNVTHIPMGVYDSDCRGTLTAAEDGGSALFVVKNGNPVKNSQIIEMVTVDHFTAEYGLESVDFIKADLEGCELEMLRGSIRTLEIHKPRLAISIYHSLSDMIRVPLFLLDTFPDYRLYVRHRSRRPQATVLYAVQV
jgi:FkbM family methyltransferase